MNIELQIRAVRQSIRDLDRELLLLKDANAEVIAELKAQREGLAQAIGTLANVKTLKETVQILINQE